MERIARFMELFWLALAGLTAIWAVYVLLEQGWDKGRTWLLFPVVCAAMFGYRRFMRGRMERWEEQRRTEEERNGK